MMAKRLLGTISGLAIAATLIPASVGGAAAEPGSGLQWGKCPAEQFTAERAECATFQVPMDYSKPKGKKITLTMSRIPATGEKRGVIAGNPGGPGGSALGMFSDASRPHETDESRVKLPAEVQKHYDQIAVQPRGLADGEALKCNFGMMGLNLIPGFAAGLFRDLCNFEQPGYADQVTTQNTARDLDWARALLGEDKLSLYGVSYGGFLMGTYATMFPNKVDRSLIDSSVSPKDAWFKAGRDREPWRRDSLHNLFQWIADRDDEYHLGKTPLQVYQRWAKVIDKETGVPAQVTPPPARIGDLPAGLKPHADVVLPVVNQALPGAWRLGSGVVAVAKNKSGATLMSPLFNVTYFGALYNEELRPIVAEYVRTGKMPDMPGEELGPNGLPVNPMTGEEMTEEQMMKLLEQQMSMATVERSIVCNDNATPVRPDLLPKLWADRLTGGDVISVIENGIGSGEMCAGWPLPRPGRPIDGSGLAVKPLHLGFDHDSAVTGNALWEMRDALGGEAIQLPGYAHGVMISAPDKVKDRVTDYFLK